MASSVTLKPCAACGVEMVKPPKRTLAQWDKQVTCSRKCRAVIDTGKSRLLASGRLYGNTYVDHRGYLRAVDSRHPGKSARQVHRIVMEHSIGRALSPSEHVHHINHNPLDNRIENLQIIERRAHIELHATPLITLTCPNCGKTRQKRIGKVRRYRYGSCNDCRNVFVSKSLRRLHDHLRFVWFLHRGPSISDFYETTKEAYDNGPSVPKRKDRTLLRLNRTTGEVSVMNRRKNVPTGAAEMITKAARAREVWNSLQVKE